MIRRCSLAIDPVLVVACAVFVAAGWWAAGLLPVGHEEISCFPNRGAQVLVADDRGSIVVEPSCLSGDTFLISSHARPELSLCAGGLNLPLLVSSYASGVFYWHALAGWPLHGGDAFALRRWNLVAGLISLVLAYLLALRLTGDRAVAGATSLVLCVSPAFILLHGMLLQYETTPWMLMASALLVALGGQRADDAPSTRRMIVAGALVGLAVLANIKAVFTLAIILLVAWRAGALGRVSRPAWRAAGAAAVAGPVLLLVANGLQGGASLRQQSVSRFGILLQPVSASELAAEAINVVRFATDTGSYGTGEWTPLGPVGLLAALAFVLSVLFAVGVGVRFVLFRGRHPLLAGCGLLTAAYYLISLKLYDQQPPANYAPLYVVFGLTLSLGLRALAGRLSVTGWKVFLAPSRTVLVAATACALLLGAGTVRRVHGVRTLPLSFNAHAERALSDYLLDHPLPEALLHTTTYNLAGVLDSLGRGELVTRRLDRLLYCDRREAAREECLTQRWKEILRSPGVVPTRLVLPDVETLTDENDSAMLQTALDAAARASDLVVTREASFTNAEGRRALLLVRVDRRR